MTLNEKLQIETQNLAVKYDIDHDVALVLLCAGSELTLEHVQNLDLIEMSNATHKGI